MRTTIVAVTTTMIFLSIGVAAEKPSGVWETYTASQGGLPSDNVYSVTIDESNNLWIGTDKGIALYDGQGWSVYSVQANFTFAILADKNETWLGTDAGLFRLKDGSSLQYNRSQGNLPSDLVRVILKDTQGNIWAGTDKGLGIFNGRAWVILSKANSPIPSDVINTLAMGKDGRIWVGTDGGAAVFQGGRWTLYRSKNSGLSSDYVHAIALDEASGDVWFGTSGGLSRLNEKRLFSKWFTFTPDNSKLLSYNVYALTLDQNRRLWIGTDRGLNYLDNKGRWDSYAPAQGRSGADSISGMAIDKDGNLWLRTSGGLGRLQVSAANR
jgi:ligand-binding sensor domain-containing protein